MEASLDTASLPEAFASCACCVRESLDAAGILLDCAPVTDAMEVDAWPTP